MWVRYYKLVVKNKGDNHVYTFHVRKKAYPQLKGEIHFKKQMKKGSLGFVYLE